MGDKAFSMGGTTATISASTTSASAAITGTTGTIRIYNAGSVAVFVKTGVGSATATTSDLPIAPGTVEAFSIPLNHNTFAAITASGTATVYVTDGNGI